MSRITQPNWGSPTINVIQNLLMVFAIVMFVVHLGSRPPAQK